MLPEQSAGGCCEFSQLLQIASPPLTLRWARRRGWHFFIPVLVRQTIREIFPGSAYRGFHRELVQPRGKSPVHRPYHKLVVRQAIRELSLRRNALSGKHPDILPGAKCCYCLASVSGVPTWVGVPGISPRVGSTEGELPVHRPYHKLVVKQATRELSPRRKALSGKHPDILPGQAAGFTRPRYADLSKPLLPRYNKKHPEVLRLRGVCYGAAIQIRTGDLILTKDALYQLSYSSKWRPGSGSNRRPPA